MHKRVMVILVLLSLILPLVSSATVGGVVINSFRISNGGEINDEYVEILNKGPEEVDLTDWKLGRKTAGGSASYLRTIFPAGTKIAPGGKLIIAHPLCSCNFDLPYATSTGSLPTGLAADNTIILYNKERLVIDKVGYGKAIDVESAGLAESPKDGEIYSRKNNGQDTDNNREDFYLAYTPPPKEPANNEPDEEASVPVAVVNRSVDIRVNEFMANPEGADSDGEWIEIYNAGTDADISGFYIGDLIGSAKKYKLPKGTIIGKGQYLAFYTSKTPISLNNDNEAIQFLSPEGKVLSASPESGKGKEGFSFAYDGSGWSWTSRPTPGTANIIDQTGSDSPEENKEVLALVDDTSLPKRPSGNVSETEKNNDRLLGYSLIFLAIVGGISYTLYVNKEKMREHYYRFREENHRSWSKIWSRIKRR